MTPVQIETHVGPDGVLMVRVPMGTDQANVRVKVTVEPVPGHTELGDNGGTRSDDQWHRFVDETYGSCAGSGLERQAQGELNQRGRHLRLRDWLLLLFHGAVFVASVTLVVGCAVLAVSALFAPVTHRERVAAGAFAVAFGAVGVAFTFTSGWSIEGIWKYRREGPRGFDVLPRVPPP